MAQRIEPPAPAVSGEKPLRVGGDIKEPKKIRDVSPIYPRAAQAAGVQGSVILEVTVGSTGHVVDAVVLQGHLALAESALNAVRQWEYEPTVHRGVPVPVITTVVVNFSLNRGGLESFGRPGYGLPIAPRYDLTGEWRGDDGGTYQMRTVGDELFWSGVNTPDEWASVFHGSLTAPDAYSGRWVGVPPGTNRGSGRVGIRVIGPDEIVVVFAPPELTGRRWRRVIEETPGSVEPEPR